MSTRCTYPLPVGACLCGLLVSLVHAGPAHAQATTDSISTIGSGASTPPKSEVAEATVSAPVFPRIDPPRDAPTSPPPKPTRQWYGWQTLIVDGLALGLVAGALSNNTTSGSSSVLGAGALTYVFGAPIVHTAHGSTVTGLRSFSMRVIAPIALAFVGAVVAKTPGAVVGIVHGVGGAIVFDAAIFARDPPEARVRASRRAVRSAPSGPTAPPSDPVEATQESPTLVPMWP